LTKSFSGEQGKVKKLHCVKVEFAPKDPNTGKREMREIPGSEFEVKADLVLLALGFLGPVKTGLISDLKLELDERGNVKTDANFMTSLPGVFSAGDMHRGQSLVVWAIKEGRNAADGVNRFLS
jgi:glutamate synthase (NADPH/NADH) small chain